MFNRGWRLHIEERQTSLETAMNGVRSDVGALSSDVRDMKESIGAVGGAVSDLANSLSSTDGRAAERAQAVKLELRDESQRKADERKSMITTGAGLFTAMAVVIAALCGPYISQINATAHGQADDAFHIGQVRETQAQQGADINRVQVGLDLSRERNHLQDAELREHDQDIAFLKGVMAAKGFPIK